jgi:cytosine/adenosine deaminase-related metal-dependent hydrolase
VSGDLRLWCEHAWLGGPGSSGGVVIDISAGRITEVTSGVAVAPAGAITLPGVTLPGFVSGFAALSDRALRGHVGGRAELRAASAELSHRLDLERWTALAEAVMAEMSLAGFTTVGAIVPVVEGLEPLRVFRAMIDAAERVGLRVTGLIPAPTASDDPQAVEHWSSSLTDTVEFLRGHDLCRAATFLADAGSSSVASLKTVVRWTGQMGIPLIARVSPDLETHLACKAAHEATPIEVFDRTGALANRGGFIAVHGVAMSETDAATLGHRRGSICVTASGDRDVGTGVLSLTPLRNAGARVIVGTGLGAVLDPFLELRTMEGHARLTAGRRPVLQPAELLRAATSEGTVALGWRDTGLLASDQRADFVTVSLTTPRMAGACSETLLAYLASSATAADVTHVVVGGELIAQHGRHRLGDVAAMLRDAIAAVGHLI